MSHTFYPLVINNCTNEDIICRYMKGGQHGRAELRIGPRGQARLQDAYQGMIIYASNMFDPASAFASLQLNQEVDEVHFTATGSGYGRGEKVGPPQNRGGDDAFEQSRVAVRERGKQRQKEMEAASALQADVVPGDAADIHGSSLQRAYSGDLLHQGDGVGVGEGENGESDRVWVPNLGWMAPESIPPHVRAQLAQRQAIMREQGIRDQRQAAPNFPNYDEQQVAAQIDGVKLPPVRLKSERPTQGLFGALTSSEKYLAVKMEEKFGWSEARCNMCARPAFLLLIGLFLYTAAVIYKRYRRVPRPSMRRRFMMR